MKEKKSEKTMVESMEELRKAWDDLKTEFLDIPKISAFLKWISKITNTENWRKKL